MGTIVPQLKFGGHFQPKLHAWLTGGGFAGRMTQAKNPFRYFDSSPEVIRLVVMMYVGTVRLNPALGLRAVLLTAGWSASWLLATTRIHSRRRWLP